MPPQNGSRGYLAEEVKFQREELTKLGKEVANSAAWLAQLIEAEKRAREYRETMQGEISAARAEQQQVAMSVASIQVDIAKLAKIQGEHETERQQGKGAWSLASASAKTVGGIIIGVIIAISGFAVFLYKVLANLPSLFKGAP